MKDFVGGGHLLLVCLPRLGARRASGRLGRAAPDPLRVRRNRSGGKPCRPRPAYRSIFHIEFGIKKVSRRWGGGPVPLGARARGLHSAVMGDHSGMWPLR